MKTKPKEAIRTDGEYMKEVIVHQQQHIEKLTATIRELSDFNHLLLGMIFQRTTISLPPKFFYDEDE